MGLAKGLVGLSLLLLICDGRRTNGLLFSGESDATLVWLKRGGAALVGEASGVAARTVAGEAEFWRRKGDCRPLSWKERGQMGEVSIVSAIDC